MASPKPAKGTSKRSTRSESIGLASRNRLALLLQSQPRVFFDQVLAESLEASGAVAGQIWALNDIGQLTRISTTSVEAFQPFSSADVVDRHRALLSQTLAGNAASTTPFRDAALDGLERVIYSVPLQLQHDAVGVVELILERPPDEARKIELQQILDIAANYLNDRATRVDVAPRTGKAKGEPSSTIDEMPSPTSSSMSACDVEEFVLLLHNQSDLDHVATTTVNEIRRLVHCDRVCLATKSGSNCEVNAVSGQDTVVRKSNMVRALRKLCEHAIVTGREVRFEAGEDDFLDNAVDLIAEYLDASGATWLRVMPLFAPEKIDFESSLHVANRVPFAALVIEQFSGTTPPDTQSIERLGCQVALAAWHALKQQEIFLVPARRRMGQWLSTAKLTRNKALIGIGSFALFACLLTFIKAPYHVPATGRLMPAKQFRAYAPFDGQVQKVWVESGQAVHPGEVLLDVHSEVLAARALSIANELAEKQKLLSAYKAQLNGIANQQSSSDQIALSAKIAQLTLETAGLAEQQEMNRQMLERSKVRSPMSGTIATFQPGALLNGRPVARGELLLEVMDESGPWQIELQIPEKRVGHLLREQESGRNLSVAFVTAIDPERSHAATIEQMANRVSTSEDGTSAMPLTANISLDSNLRPAIGAEVTARIQCGQRSLGYVWFGDVFDWVSSKFW